MRLIPPLPVQEPFAELIDWRVRELARLGVELVLGLEADADECARRSPDVVVVATGADPRRSGLAAGRGRARGRVARRRAGRRARLRGPPQGRGRRRDARGAGREVTLVALGPSALGALTYSTVGALALRRLAALGVRLVEGHRLVAVEDGAVRLARTYDGTPLALETRAVVHASPHTPADGARARAPGESDPGPSRGRCTRTAPRRGRDRRRLRGRAGDLTGRGLPVCHQLGGDPARPRRDVIPVAIVAVLGANGE